jgi:ribosomal-protein-alanine N-acetyltransferase
MVPVLRTTRLELSEFHLRDAEDVFSYASDPAVAKTVTWEAHRSLEDSTSFLKFAQSQTCSEENKKRFVWALRRDGRAIGSISFVQLAPHFGQIDYALGAKFWNQGLMSEAALEVVKWAFEAVPGLMRIQAKCLVTNAGSRRVMEKIGMEYEGITQAAMIVKEKPVDLATYSVLRPKV